MNNNSKVLTAVLSVVIMLGCALVPFATYDTNGSVASDSEKDDTGDFSFSDIIAPTPGPFDNLPKLSVRSYIPIPVGNVSTSPTVLSNDVGETKHIGVGKVVTLEGNYKFENNGCYVIDKGATLVLFPLTEINTSFSLCNKNGNNEGVIQMESGSRISVFGMTFEIELVDGSESLSLFLLSKCGDNESCSFTYKRTDTGYFEFSMCLNSISSVSIADDIRFLKEYMLTEFGGNVIHATGTILPSSEDIGIVLSCLADVHGIIKENGHTKTIDYNFGSLKIDNLLLSYVPRTSGADVKFSLSANLDYYLEWDPANYLGIISRGLSINTGVIDLSVKKANDGISIDVLSQDKFRLSLKPCSISITPPIVGLTVNLSAESNMDIVFEGLKVSMNYVPNEVPNEEDTWALISHVGGDVSINIGKYELLTNYNRTIVEYDSDYGIAALICADFRDVVLHLDGLTYDYNHNENEWGFGVKEVNGTKTMSDCFSRLNEEIDYDVSIINDPFCLLYPVDFTTNITDIELESIEDKSNATQAIKISLGQLSTDFAVSHRSNEWNGNLVLDGLEAYLHDSEPSSLNDLEISSLSLSRLYFRNDVPMTEAFSVFPEFSSSNMGVISIPNIDLELENVSFDPTKSEEKITGDSMSFTLGKFLNVDEFNVSMGGFGISNGDNWNISSDRISGYVTNEGQDKKTFSITDSPSFRIKFDLDEIDWSHVITLETIRYSAVLEIVSGKADFSGGSLPFGIKVDDGATFSSQSLTALGFTFENDCTLIGTVSIDTDATLPFCYSWEKSRTIQIVSDTGNKEAPAVIYALEPQTDGYVMSFDFAKRLKEGTLVANDECRLPSHFEGEGFEMTSPDGLKGSFKITSDSGAKLNIICDKTSYRLTYNGTDFISYAHGTPVIIPTQVPSKEGLEFFGWNDGTTMHYPGDTFIMPKHDVVMTPVYCKNVEPEFVVEGDVTVLVVDAPDAEMVKINMMATEGWDKMRVTVGDTTFEMDGGLSFQYMFPKNVKGGSSTCDYLYFQSVQVKTSIDSVDGTMYDLKVYYSQFDSVTLREVTKQLCRCNAFGPDFRTTVKVFASADVKDIIVYEIDPDGMLCPMDDVTIVKLNNSTYEVSFDVYHPAQSQYFIAPVYSESSYVPIVIVVAIFLLLAVVGVYFWSRERSEIKL